ncbi:unnamed protein product [Cuscuta campestris]|uniref:Uncharacterized protein n=1 Tax=Cuscuta campestris TaxID=132261 RepID=A0A484KCK0_9ASTE|nr:unnamed protein product [Cuscuta campestris]
MQQVRLRENERPRNAVAEVELSIAGTELSAVRRRLNNLSEVSEGLRSSFDGVQPPHSRRSSQSQRRREGGGGSVSLFSGDRATAALPRLRLCSGFLSFLLFRYPVCGYFPRRVCVVSDTPIVYASDGNQEIEQLSPNCHGNEGEIVAAVMPDSEEEDEPSEALMAPSSEFVCVRNHACDSFLKLMFPGWDSPKYEYLFPIYCLS